jgi:hypothetical protein
MFGFVLFVSFVANMPGETGDTRYETGDRSHQTRDRWQIESLRPLRPLRFK